MDKISVIVPVYNAEQYLERCVKSIIDQTYKNLEIILVDDGSTDNSGKMCDELSQKDERIHVIHKENGGSSSARNIGIKKASGDCISFIDSDDYIEADMIETLYQKLKDNNADVAAISIAMVRENGKKINGTDTKETYIYEGNEIIKQLLLHDTIKNYSCDKLYKKKLFEKVAFPEGISYEDVPTSMKIMREAQKVVYYDSIKYYYVKHKNTISANCSERNVNNYLNVIINRYNELEEKNPQMEEFNLYAIANTTTHAYYKAMLSNLPLDTYREKLNFLVDKCKYINESRPNIIDRFSVYQKACFFMLLNDEDLFIKFLETRQEKNRSNSASQ